MLRLAQAAPSFCFHVIHLPIFLDTLPGVAKAGSGREKGVHVHSVMSELFWANLAMTQQETQRNLTGLHLPERGQCKALQTVPNGEQTLIPNFPSFAPLNSHQEEPPSWSPSPSSCSFSPPRSALCPNVKTVSPSLKLVAPPRGLSCCPPPHTTRDKVRWKSGAGAGLTPSLPLYRACLGGSDSACLPSAKPARNENCDHNAGESYRAEKTLCISGSSGRPGRRRREPRLLLLAQTGWKRGWNLPPPLPAVLLLVRPRRNLHVCCPCTQVRRVNGTTALKSCPHRFP